MATQLLTCNHMVQPRNFAHILLRLVAVCRNTLLGGNGNVSIHLGGGSERGTAQGDLGIINPKSSPIKQRTWHLYEGSYGLLGPV